MRAVPADPPIKRELGLTTRPPGTWVQTDRVAHDAWALMGSDHPRASALLHIIISNMGRHNAVVMSQAMLAKLARCSDRTVRRSLDVLRKGNWIEVRQMGPTGTVKVFIVNDRVAWAGSRDGIRYSMFGADIVVCDAEQPDATELGAQEPLQRVPTLFPGERQ
jgi:hypothetical protein